MLRASCAALAAAISVVLAGCAGNGEGLDGSGRPIDHGPAPLEATFDSIQQNVFTPICTQCHIGAQAPAGLRLDAASSYAMLVNTASTEVPSLRRVQPGNPDASYLLQKLQGIAAVGARMPLNNPPLPQATIDVIRQWISDGAQSSAASSADVMPASLQGVTPQSADILSQAPRQILLQATGQLDATRLTPQNISLIRSGRDGSFSEGNEVVLHVLRIELHSDRPTVLAIIVPGDEWVPDSYQLTVSAAGPAPVADLAGTAIDGDADGASGGDFVLQFELGETL